MFCVARLLEFAVFFATASSVSARRLRRRPTARVQQVLYL